MSHIQLITEIWFSVHLKSHPVCNHTTEHSPKLTTIIWLFSVQHPTLFIEWCVSKDATEVWWDGEWKPSHSDLDSLQASFTVSVPDCWEQYYQGVCAYFYLIVFHLFNHLSFEDIYSCFLILKHHLFQSYYKGPKICFQVPKVIRFQFL